jgi:molecular chaperone DnaK
MNIDSNEDRRVFEVVATSGDTNLGGCDFDNALVEYMIASFKANTKVDLM